MNADISKLNDEQRAQVEKQWRAHQHGYESLELEVDSSDGKWHLDLDLFPGVWNPTITCARHFAGYLGRNGDRLCRDKDVLDLATGTGVQGLVALLEGARRVVFSDISQPAFVNTVMNLYRLFSETAGEVYFHTDTGLGDHGDYRFFEIFDRRSDPNIFRRLKEKNDSPFVLVVEGDLFDNISGKFDTILFNQPFFDGVPSQGDTIEASMLDPGELIQRFLRKAPRYLRPNGVIVMPAYTKAPVTNNPLIQGQKHGYNVREGARIQSTEGLQQGEILIYELTREG